MRSIYPPTWTFEGNGLDMPRPRKLRYVGCLPESNSFGPLDSYPGKQIVVMTVDEYETIRLIDLLGLSQEECAGRMNIARTTVQSIYNVARKKQADSLVNGRMLKIEGGCYKLCGGFEASHDRANCRKRKQIDYEQRRKNMKLIVPVESKSLDAPVCPSFGRTPLYVLFDTENGTHEFLDNAAAASQGGAGIKAAQMLVDNGAAAIITYRCGENAAQVLNAAGVKMYKAQDGSVKDNIAAFKEGKLSLLAEIHPGFHNHGGGKE
jgi:predicted DNA-binding protein (UPF0251 family)/predicted Fe-Mo cluster-binding NifX family protein